MVLRLYHHESGQVVPVRRARPGELHTYTVCPAEDGQARPRDLRCYLVSDLIRRAAERRRLRVTAWHNIPDGRPPGPAGWAGGVDGRKHGTQTDGQNLHANCDALNIYPAAYAARSPEPLDVGIGPARDCAPGEERPGHWVYPADVMVSGSACVPPGGDDSAAAHPAVTAQLTARGMDPLALRLAFLQAHYRQPLALTWDVLAVADESLRCWRRQVAGWACSPSRPMSIPNVAQVAAAFDDDLATPAALGTLRALAQDGGVPPGAKFETFAYTDRLLGLDLAREVGR